VFQNLRREIVFLRVVLPLQVFRDTVLADAAGVGARGMEECAARSTSAVHDVFGESLEVVGVVVLFVADHVHETCPATTDADNLVTFAERAKRHGTDRWIKAGDVAPAGEDANYAFLHIDISHSA